MQRVLLILFLFSVSSCQFFDAQKTTSEAILEAEQKAINWNDVDEFPTFSVCDSLQTKQDKNLCFQNTITAHISKNLQEQIIIVSKDVADTVKVELLISEKGIISLINTKAKNTTLNQIPNLEELLNSSLKELPEVFPAIKRGQHVKTLFKLPIILEVN